VLSERMMLQRGMEAAVVSWPAQRRAGTRAVHVARLRLPPPVTATVKSAMKWSPVSWTSQTPTMMAAAA